MTPAQRRELTDRQHRSLSIVRQCQLMGVSRSSLYYRPKGTPLEVWPESGLSLAGSLGDIKHSEG